MKSSVTIVDYGIGNLFSVCRALEHCGATPILTSSAAEIEAADRLILPGVGAFKDGMRGLYELKLADPIRKYCTGGRPFLGICLGMQMMMENSEEFGHHEGLGVVPGIVTAIPRESAGVTRKVPHIGWNALRQCHSPTNWEQTILAGLAPGTDAAYFVHSYSVEPAKPSHRLAECSHDDYPITAVLRDGHLYGCQFHPEKSGKTGLTIIRNFCRL